MMNRVYFRLSIVVTFLSSQSARLAHALPQYASLIPNGNSVPNPIDGGVWIGVGHVNVAGGGPNDQFGIDFKQAGYFWSQAFCQQDSDGDGLTNGQELGDPDCIWYEGGPSPVGPAVSHPGIAEGAISVTTGGTQGGKSSEEESDSEDEDDEDDESATSDNVSFTAYQEESAGTTNKCAPLSYTLLAFVLLELLSAIPI